MATVFTLGPAGDTIDLADITKHYVALEGIAPQPSRKTTIVSISGRDAVRLAYDQATELLLPVTVSMTGATHDAFIANWRGVLDKLRKAREFSLDGKGSQVEFTYKWDGATASVVFDVIRGQFPAPPALSNPFMPQFIDAPLLLVCQPYGRAASASTASSGTITNDNTGYTPAAVGGDVQTPCRLRIQNKQASVNMNFIRAATRSRGTVANFIFQYIPGDTAPSGYSVTKTNVALVGVSGTIRYRANTGGNTIIVHFGFRSGGTFYQVASFTTTSGSYATVTSPIVAIDPRTGVPWTKADIDAYEWGVRLGHSPGTPAEVTQMYTTTYWVDRDLTVTTTNLLPTANGSVNDWTATGVAEGSEYDAVNDPVGTPDDTTTYISGTALNQVSVYATEDTGTPPAGDAGVTLAGLADTEMFRLTLSTNLADHYGAYRVMARCKGTTGDELQLKWGGATGALIANPPVALGNSAQVQVVDLGRMNIPEQEAPSDVSLASFVFSLWRGTGTSALYIDAVELWPAENYVEFEPTTGPATDEFAVSDSLARVPTAFLANSSGARVQTLTHHGAAPELAVGTNRVFVRASRSRLDDRRADSLAVDLRYFQRYEYQRGAG